MALPAERLRGLIEAVRRGWAARETGARAERQAARWLEDRCRFKVVARNWRNPRDEREEIDLICRDGAVLVFVEVKARAEGALVSGVFAVDARKKRVLLSAAKAYLRRLHPMPQTFRFDIVDVTVRAGGEPEIRHFGNVALFPKQFRS